MAMAETSSSIQVTVKTLDQIIPLEVTASDTAKDVKRVLQAGPLRDAARDKKMRLIYLGKLLKDSDLVIDIVAPDGVLHCFMSERTANNMVDDDNWGEGRIQTVDPEQALAEDRRLAEILQRETLGFGGDRTESRRRRRRAGTEESRDPYSSNPLTGFLLSFAIGFMFGVITLLLFQRLSRSQSIGLSLGVAVNFYMASLNQTKIAMENSQAAETERIMQGERLDRFGNVLPPISTTSNLRGG